MVVWVWLGSFFLVAWEDLQEETNIWPGDNLQQIYLTLTMGHQAGMEQSPQRAGDWPHSGSGFRWSTRLALIQTPDFCIWNSGSYSRDTASLWLRNTGHISGFPWSQERGLHGSSLHMAYQGISQALQHHKPSPLINPLPHISAGSRDKNTPTQRSGINIQLKTAAEPLYLGENMLGPFIKRKIP